jgi:hypothetical protein
VQKYNNFFTIFLGKILFLEGLFLFFVGISPSTNKTHPHKLSFPASETFLAKFRNIPSLPPKLIGVGSKTQIRGLVCTNRGSDCTIRGLVCTIPTTDWSFFLCAGKFGWDMG